jgi:hypothetical protein
MKYLLITYQWRHLTRLQVADFKCLVTPFPFNWLVVIVLTGGELVGLVEEFKTLF